MEGTDRHSITALLPRARTLSKTLQGKTSDPAQVPENTTMKRLRKIFPSSHES